MFINDLNHISKKRKYFLSKKINNELTAYGQQEYYISKSKIKNLSAMRHDYKELTDEEFSSLYDEQLYEALKEYLFVRLGDIDGI